MALTAADLNAEAKDYAAALRWLEVAERLDLTLAPEYALRRAQWQREQQPTERGVRPAYGG
jgi:hypothetical protein